MSVTESKATALALAAQLQTITAELALLTNDIPGLSAHVDSINQSTQGVIDAANAAQEPPVIVVRLTSITPDDVPGASDQEKVVNAHAEAIERGIPMRWNRVIPVRNITLTEAHDGLEIIADPDCGPILAQGLTNPQGLLYHVLPAAGQRAEVTMRGLTLLGNRANNTADARQNAITLGNVGAGSARLILDGCTIAEWHHAGVIVWGDGCEVFATDSLVRDTGDCGFGTTRGRMTLIGCEMIRCAIGANASAGDLSILRDCHIHHSLGGGVKVSLRVDGSEHPARLEITNTRIEDNAHWGLNSTSASAGTVVSGDNVVFARNGLGAINITDLTELRMGRVTSTNDSNHDNDDSSAILLSGAGRARFGSLTVTGSAWRGVNGGWDRNLSISRLSIDGCAGPGLRWVNAPIAYGEYVPGANGGPDELVNN